MFVLNVNDVGRFPDDGWQGAQRVFDSLVRREQSEREQHLFAGNAADLMEQVVDLDDLVLQFDGTDAGKRFIEAWKRARNIVDTGGGHSGTPPTPPTPPATPKP